MRTLRTAAGVEFASLLVLLVNLATVHWPAVSSLTGPTHGCAYLFVIVQVMRTPGTNGRTKLYALLPGVGGLLALRQYGRRQPATAQGPRAAERR
ncbi:DUF3817 domain-containing protein [Streptomyces clavifer]|uniref:DUF3817 domain-containing protein n=1 Tax=Streptomyces clavifer TaxID=68188 RepID=UPI0033AE4C14